MDTFLKIHFLGSFIAVALQFIVSKVAKRKMGILNDYIVAVSNGANHYGLHIDASREKLLSDKLNESIGISGSACPAPTWSLSGLIQSLILGWINVLLIGFGLLGLLSMSENSGLNSDEIEKMKHKINQLKNPSNSKELVIEELKGLASLNIESPRLRSDIKTFINEHFRSNPN